MSGIRREQTGHSLVVGFLASVSVDSTACTAAAAVITAPGSESITRI
jgi:hypothetical protein